MCISADNTIENCLEYNESGIGCKMCSDDLRGLEDKGCVPPPFCLKVEYFSLKCLECISSDYILDVTG